MTGFIDIYAKLIIAVVSFIAPLMVYLLSVYSDGIVIVRENATEELLQLREILRLQLIGQENFSSKSIKKSTKSLEKSEKVVQRKINLLTPKRQIYRIFINLFLAILFLMLYMLDKDVGLKVYNHYVCLLLLFSSIGCFIAGMLILRQVAWVSIETKEEIARKTKEIEITSQKPNEIISPTV